MTSIYLAHVAGYNPASSTVETLRFCTGIGFVTDGNAAMRPAGVPAHVAYLPRIQQPALLRRDCFDRGTTGGASKVAYGELVLANPDGELDYLLEWGFAGRAVEIVIGTVEPWGLPQFATVLKGTLAVPSLNEKALTFRLRDRQAELDKPLQPVKFGGTNTLPAGLDGVEGDLKGKDKPKVFGKAWQVPVPCVNTSRQIYQLADGLLTSATLYHRGEVLTAGAAYASQADMEANAPAAGQVRLWLAAGGSYARLGTAAYGAVTADLVQGAAAGNRTVAQLCQQIITGPGGVVGADVSTADLTALDAENSAEVGVAGSDGMTCAQALDLLTNSVGAWWGVDRLGTFRVARLDVPSGTPVAELDASNILKLDRMDPGAGSSSGDAAGIPAWRVTVRYQHYDQTQADVAGAVPDATKAALKQEWRTVVAEDATVKTLHPLAVELTFDTRLASAAAATAEAARLLGIYKVRRDRFECRVAVDATLAAAVDLGGVVRVTHPRFLLSAGKLLRVIGLRPDLARNRLDLTLWG